MWGGHLAEAVKDLVEEAQHMATRRLAFLVDLVVETAHDLGSRARARMSRESQPAAHRDVHAREPRGTEPRPQPAAQDLLRA